jgi:serine phosphatase RsbU (regulator of sigma subunit)
MTACCALIDSRGNLTFAGAGHPPLFVRRADGTVEAFESQGTILGLEDGSEFGQSRTKLRLGDLAVLYTDGLFTFKHPDGTRLSHEDLRTALGTVAPGEAYFERLLETVRAGSDGEPCGDDIAAIALQRREAGL